MRRTFLSFIALLLSGAASLSAQQPDTVAVLESAVTFARARHPEGKLVHARTPDERSSVLKCMPRRPTSCRLAGADVLVQTTPLRLENASARVSVAVWTKSGVGQSPIQRQTWVLRLGRTAKGWVVEGVEEQGAT